MLFSTCRGAIRYYSIFFSFKKHNIQCSVVKSLVRMQKFSGHNPSHLNRSLNFHPAVTKSQITSQCDF